MIKNILWQKISDPYHFDKYNPPFSKGLLVWSIIQLMVLFAFMVYVLSHVSIFGDLGLYTFAIFVGVQVYSATELMNRNPLSPLFSVISTLVCGTIYYFDNSWYGISAVSALLPSVFLLYFLFQIMMSIWFSVRIKSLSSPVL